LLVGGTFTNYSGTALNSLARLETLSPNYFVAGRIIDTKGAGISGAMVKLTDSSGNVRTAITDSLGYYQFDTVAAGETHTISVSAKRNRFNPSSKVITARGDIDNLNFISSR
jgi:protocatechuate 3,4-dioxygenase beta subunit